MSYGVPWTWLNSQKMSGGQLREETEQTQEIELHVSCGLGSLFFLFFCFFFLGRFQKPGEEGMYPGQGLCSLFIVRICVCPSACPSVRCSSLNGSQKRCGTS